MRKKRKQDLNVGYHVVAFMDLMGQQELLRSLTSLPNKNDKKSYEEFIDSLRDTYGAVLRMRDVFRKTIDGFDKKVTPPKFIQKDKKALFKELKSNPIRLNQFSDFVIAFFSLRNDQGAKLPVSGIYGLLHACAATQLISLASGNPVRGALELGVNLEIKYNEIYGSSIARSYAIESHVANYPRVVVGNELQSYLISVSQQDTSDDLSRISAALAETCMDMLAVDSDGYPFIDFIGNEVFKSAVDSELYKNLIQKSYDFVLNASVEYQESQNSKLAFKYALLRKYIESRLPLWGLKVEV